MEIKTSKSYKKEVIEKYNREKGGEMSSYLANPTRKNIREACLWLLNRRKGKNDDSILNRFFQFNVGEDKGRHIQGLKSEKADKFIPVINFLKGRTNDTSDENLELISWLINFQPRPLQEYLKPENSIFEKELERSETKIIDEPNDKVEKKKHGEGKRRLEEAKRKKEKKRRRRIITISISVAFGMTMLILGIQNWPLNIIKNNLNGVECMTWADSTYVTISCDRAPLSQFGTEIQPFDKIKLKNMKKVEVDAAFEFFNEENKPLIWYYKNKDSEYEYFTAPGLHPVTGQTLRKITPYIIKTYVPIHKDNANSFLNNSIK